MSISMIACVGKNLELGKNNDLIWHLPNDLKFFKQTTLNKTVIMGRRTFESLPKKLPNRRNIVLMLPEEEKIPDVDIFYSVNDILEEIRKIDEEVFIIGGASIYRQFLPYADKLYLTEVPNEDKDATVYFPQFDKKKYRRIVIGKNSDNNIEYQHVLYERI